MNASQRATLLNHCIVLACYRGTENDPLEEAYKDVHDLTGRKVLLAVFTVARQMAEAEYYRCHSALADSDATEQAAQAQIREAHDNRDRVLDNILDALLREVPKFIEEPLAKGAAGDAGRASHVADEMAGVAITVAAVRELMAGQGNQLSPEANSATDTRDEYI